MESERKGRREQVRMEESADWMKQVKKEKKRTVWKGDDRRKGRRKREV